MVEERVLRLREEGMLKCICYVKLKKTPTANDSPRKAYVHQSNVACACFGSSNSTRSSAVWSPRLTVGRDAVKKTRLPEEPENSKISE